MKTALLVLILLLSFACNYSSGDKTQLQPLPQNTTSTVSTPTEQRHEISDFTVYSQVLTSIVYGTNLPDSKDVFEYIDGYEWLTIRKETVVPENLEGVKSLPDLPEDLKQDFIEKNQSKASLGSGYDVKILHDVVEQKGSLEELFKLEKKKHPKLRAIIGLSRIGFSADKTKSLVYVEYFNPEKRLMKKYCLTGWKWEGQSLRTESAKWL